MGTKRLTIFLACLWVGFAALAEISAANAQSDGKVLSDDELQKDYFLCTFPVSNTNFSANHVNDVIDACTKLINSPGGSAENRSIVHLQRGAMYRRLGKYKLALADFTMSIHYNPKSAYAYTGRGNAHRGLHQIDEAIADHTKAIELDPTYAEAYNNRGNTWREKKDNKHAMADYDEAIKINPHYALAFYNRANARLDEGDKQGAIADYREAIKINPNFEQAADMLKKLKAKP